jgi:IS1 family transposase
MEALVEGNSFRATARMTGVGPMTVEKSLCDLGAACARYQDGHLRNLSCQRIQCDEIWSFIFAKYANVTADIAKRHPDARDIWTWTALNADSKLVLSWFVGSRDASAAYAFMTDVAARLRHRVQLTTDGHTPYLSAVEDAFGGDIDCAMLQKIYGSTPEGERRYSPAVCLGAIARPITGNPNPKHISTMNVEPQNFTMSMHMRRFTRLTNGFNKKVEMHGFSIALHFIYCNVAKIHQTLRVTPRWKRTISDYVRSVEKLVGLLG